LGKPDVEENYRIGSVWLGVFELVGTPAPSLVPSTAPSLASSVTDPSPVTAPTKAPVNETKQTSSPTMMQPEETITIT